MIEAFFKKNKNIQKSLKLLYIGLGIIAFTCILWFLLFSKYYEFSKNEDKMLDAVKNYYAFRKDYLPANNQTRTITLEKLFLENRIEELYEPGTHNLCDTNSWVKIYNNYGKMEYNVYLKCGKYQSKVDHKGPEIELNGDNEIIVDYGTSYKELGVKSVTDDKDGKIDVKKVEIDNSRVNVNKVGIYYVTYRVGDKLNNFTTVKRKVTVVKNLTTLVKENTDETNYYRGKVDNNYILFSGMLFRIINAEKDGSIKIISNESIGVMPYGDDGYDFNDSIVKTWLNKQYYKHLNNTDYLKTNNSWCIDETDNWPTGECQNIVKNKVGLLTTYDMLMSWANNDSYLNITSEYWLMNKADTRYGYVHYINKTNGITTLDSTSMTGVRPVLVIKPNQHIIAGQGTYKNPYKLDDYDYGKTGDLLNTRITGEYVLYSGMTFRVVDQDKDGNTKLISSDFLTNNTTQAYLYAGYESEKNKFNPKEEGNIGYVLNDDFIDYISPKYIISHEFEIPEFDSMKSFDKLKKTKIKAKLSIPATYDMFSGANQMNGDMNYWLADYTKEDDATYMVNNGNGRAFNVDDYSVYKKCGFKVSMYVSNKAKIKGGNGTVNDPYVIE